MLAPGLTLLRLALEMCWTLAQKTTRARLTN